MHPKTNYMYDTLADPDVDNGECFGKIICFDIFLSVMLSFYSRINDENVKLLISLYHLMHFFPRFFKTNSAKSILFLFGREVF